MSQTAPHVEDRLLDFAYGELSDEEAAGVRGHLDGCARCRGQWEEIQGVRKVMSAAPVSPAPDAGLESLLAYAEQAARRAQAGPPPKHTWWRRLVMPLASVTAVAVIGVVAHEVHERGGTVEQLRSEVALAKLDAEAVTAAAPTRAPVTAAPQPSPLQGQLGTATNAMAEVLPAEPKPLVEVPAPRDNAAEKAPAEAVARGAGRGLSSGAGSGMGAVGSASRERERLKVIRGAPAAQVPAPEKKKAAARRDVVALDAMPPAAPPLMAAAPLPDPGKGGAPGASVAGGEAQPKPQQMTEEVAAKKEEGAEFAAAERRQRMEEAYGTRPAEQSQAAREPLATASRVEPDADDFGALADSSEAESRKDTRRSRAAAKEAERADAEDKAARARSLSEAARHAYAESDRELEARLLRQAVPLAGADRPLLSGILVRLCDAEYALGRTAAGDAACERVMREFEGSAAARIALRQKQTHYATLGGGTGTGSGSGRAPARAAPARAPAAIDQAQ